MKLGVDINKQIEELKSELDEVYDEFKNRQFDFVQQFESLKMNYQETIKNFGDTKKSSEMNKFRINTKTQNLQEDIKKRIEQSKQLKVEEIHSINAFDINNPLHEIFIWIFGIIYKVPIKNFELKKVINDLLIEEGREFILKLSTYNSKIMRESEIEATQMILQKQQEYLQEDITPSQKLQLIALFNIIQMIMNERSMYDEIDELKQKYSTERDLILLYDREEKFQNLEIQSLKDTQQTNTLFHHSLSVINKGLQKLKL